MRNQFFQYDRAGYKSYQELRITGEDIWGMIDNINTTRSARSGLQELADEGIKSPDQVADLIETLASLPDVGERIAKAFKKDTYRKPEIWGIELKWVPRGLVSVPYKYATYRSANLGLPRTDADLIREFKTEFRSAFEEAVKTLVLSRNLHAAGSAGAIKMARNITEKYNYLLDQDTVVQYIWMSADQFCWLECAREKQPERADEFLLMVRERNREQLSLYENILQRHGGESWNSNPGGSVWTEEK